MAKTCIDCGKKIGINEFSIDGWCKECAKIFEDLHPDGDGYSM